MPSDAPLGFEQFRDMVERAKMQKKFDKLIANLVARRDNVEAFTITDDIRREVNPRLVMAFWNIKGARG